MKKLWKPNILPWFTLGAGGLGLALRVWLYANQDEKGLLPESHPASVLIFVLTAIVMAVLFLSVRQLKPMSKYSRLFPAGIGRAVGCAAGAVGILCGSVGQLLTSKGLLVTLTFLAGLLAVVALGYMALLRLKGRRPSYLLHLCCSVFFMLYAVHRCQTWGSEPQLQEYLFQLLGSVFLMLTAYYLTVMDARKGSRRALVFFNQAALYCCLLSLNGSDQLFYVGIAAWLALDLCSVEVRRTITAPPPEEAA